MRVLIVRASAERRGSQTISLSLGDIVVLIGADGSVMVLDCFEGEMPLMTMPAGTRMERREGRIMFRGPDEALDIPVRELHSEPALDWRKT